MLSDILTRNLEEPFTTLGLTNDHAQVYLALLEIGPSPVSQVSKETGRPRSTVYLLLGDLTKLGLVFEAKGGDRLIFSPSSPEKLKDLLEEKARQLRRVDLDFRANFAVVQTLFESHRPSFPKVQFYEGESGLATIYRDSLWASEVLLISHSSPGKVEKESETLPNYLENFLREVGERGVFLRELTSVNPDRRSGRLQLPNHRTAIIPGNGAVDMGLDRLVFGDKVAFISHEHLVGVAIEDGLVAASEKSTFELLWSFFRHP